MPIARSAMRQVVFQSVRGNAALHQSKPTARARSRASPGAAASPTILMRAAGAPRPRSGVGQQNDGVGGQMPDSGRNGIDPRPRRGRGSTSRRSRPDRPIDLDPASCRWPRPGGLGRSAATTVIGSSGGRCHQAWAWRAGEQRASHVVAAGPPAAPVCSMPPGPAPSPPRPGGSGGGGRAGLSGGGGAGGWRRGASWARGARLAGQDHRRAWARVLRRCRALATRVAGRGAGRAGWRRRRVRHAPNHAGRAEGAGRPGWRRPRGRPGCCARPPRRRGAVSIGAFGAGGAAGAGAVPCSRPSARRAVRRSRSRRRPAAASAGRLRSGRGRHVRHAPDHARRPLGQGRLGRQEVRMRRQSCVRRCIGQHGQRDRRPARRHVRHAPDRPGPRPAGRGPEAAGGVRRLPCPGLERSPGPVLPSIPAAAPDGAGQARRVRRHGQDHDLRPGMVRGRPGAAAGADPLLVPSGAAFASGSPPGAGIAGPGDPVRR